MWRGGREVRMWCLALVDCMHCMNVPFVSAIDVNECQKNPCRNGGKCTNTRGSYRCSCAAGFQGKNCETGKGRVIHQITSDLFCGLYL